MARAGTAQFFSFDGDPERAVQFAGPTITSVDFEFDGDAAPVFDFAYDGPAYGLVYGRGAFRAAFVYGKQDSLSLLDFGLSAWAPLYLAGTGRAPTRVFIPIVLVGEYRRVAPEDRPSTGAEAFQVTLFGLGAGLGLSYDQGRRIRAEVRAHPALALASTAFVESFGTSYLFEGDAALHLVGLFGRYGLSLGYRYRTQVWNVEASNLFPEITDELFDYRGQNHRLWLGINW